jgi:Zn finger protein HypA/HybF involved in hydrogenase expression
MAQRSLIQCNSCFEENPMEDFELKKFNSKNKFYCIKCLQKNNLEDVSINLDRRLSIVSTQDLIKINGIDINTWNHMQEEIAKRIRSISLPCPKCRSRHVSKTEGTTINGVEYQTCMSCNFIYDFKGKGI